ncbi:HAMP domain-containing sensor histidine kinase [Streptomyces sp. 1331.2]|uniref:HAMP domain-containing sensor histidine kinase n=1 Tax=Streptomyces sp. 1331.2 TaxID=1938835 RepID=UPI000BD6D5C5|nr:ATP-binding protein [Streptomyces sp. 1331.2]SOB85946.1 two-component system, OmpR family, sensor histidine kinase MprB [Streptomyces sp. 1331.2]
MTGPAAPRSPRLPRTGLRTTLSLAFAAMAALVAVVIGLLGYRAAAHLIRDDETDDFTSAVRAVSGQVERERLYPGDFSSPSGLGEQLLHPIRVTAQPLDSDGVVLPGSAHLDVPTTAADRELARADTPARTVTDMRRLGRNTCRVGVVSLGGGRGAVQIVQQLGDIEELLEKLRRQMVAVVAAVVLIGGSAGWLLAGRITGRLVRLTDAAELVAASGRLDVPVPAAGTDEVGRLGRAFDRMLVRLATAKENQRRLVQDAGHELRTPLTSLRTNLSVLPALDRLPPSERAALMADLAEEARELTQLVEELVALAADRKADGEPVEVVLAELVQRAAAQARRRSDREITVDADDTVVTAHPDALARAVGNLLDNAAKFDPAGTGPIEVVVRGPRVEVRDRGPGIEEADLDRVFDRFYRATAARSLPGSGLGLAIVHEVARSHGGTAFAANREGGGAAIGFTLGP